MQNTIQTTLIGNLLAVRKQAISLQKVNFTKIKNLVFISRIKPKPTLTKEDAKWTNYYLITYFHNKSQDLRKSCCIMRTIMSKSHIL